MNAERRNRLSEVIAQLEALATELESIRDDEQEAFDNMPEGLQQSERGQKAEAACSLIDDVHGSIADAVTSLEEAAA